MQDSFGQGTRPLIGSNIDLSPEEFRKISEFVYARFGINLTEDKKTLVFGRLQKLLKKYQKSSFGELFSFVVKEETGEAISDLINNLSTNHTFFYREKSHFEYFTGTLLPELTARLKAHGSNDVRLWSAGCSSGEEPYLLIMLMKEFFGMNYAQWNSGALATDISATVLNKAARGVYGAESLQYLPPVFLRKYFKQCSEDEWEVIESVKREVTFRRFNLTNEQFPFKKKFHIIFCRNVMIYFDEPTKRRLVEKFHSVLEDGGMLFVGHSETLSAHTDLFNYVLPAGYIKR